MAIEFLKRWYPLLLFLGGISFFCLRITGFDLAYLPGDTGDPRFINFQLEHGYQWLFGNADAYWNAGFMYPFENNIAFSDNMLGTMPIYSIFRIFSASPETSFQLWWITVCSLNFWSAYFVLKKWLDRRDLAVVGALIFAFSIFNQGQILYVQMSARFMIPIVIYAGIQLVKTRQLKYVAIYGLGIVYQIYCAMYTGIFLMYFSLGIIVLYALFTRQYLFFIDFFKRDKILKTFGLVAVAGLALYWIMMPYLKMAMFAGVPLYPEVVPFLPTFSSFFHSHDSGWLLGSQAVSFRSLDSYWLHYNFPGFLLILTFIATPVILFLHWFKKKKFAPEMLALSLAAIFILALFIRTESGYTLYKAMFQFPGMSSIRVLNRFLHVEIFILIVVLLYIWKELPKKYVWLLLVLSFIDNGFDANLSVRSSKKEVVAGRVALQKEVENNRKRQHKAFAIVRTDQPAPRTHVQAMMVSQLLQFPTVNGYSSSCPGGFGTFFSESSEEGLREWMQQENLKESEILIIRIP